MDWTILPLQIILALQGVAVIGVSLMLIADSYLGNGEIDDRRSARPRWWARNRMRNGPAQITTPDRRRPADRPLQ
jgi:hypothetical protein